VHDLLKHYKSKSPSFLWSEGLLKTAVEAVREDYFFFFAAFLVAFLAFLAAFFAFAIVFSVLIVYDYSNIINIKRLHQSVK